MPTGEVPGVYVPSLAAPPGPDQLPPACAFEPKDVKRLTGPEELHTCSEELVPAFGCGTRFTVTVALAEAQGDVPDTVYVNTPGSESAGLKVPLLNALLGSVQVPPTSAPPSNGNKAVGVVEDSQ